jgi:hypothetical protein
MTIDRCALEKRWDANEAELNRIHAAPGLDRELLAKRVGSLESKQDAIEFELGNVEAEWKTFAPSYAAT